jgi:hypothetical protein
MEVSNMYKVRKAFYRGAFKLLLIFLSFFVLSGTNLLSQPVWTSGPNLTPGVITVDVSFILNQNSTVYYIALPYHYTANYSAATVKSLAISGAAALCDNGQFAYSTPGSVATITVNNFPPNTPVTIYIVAESSGGVLQLIALRLHTTTHPCPPLDIDFGYNTPQRCVNKGITQNLRFTIFDSDPDVSGIYPGTQFFINWGDGNTTTWTVTEADPMIPGVPRIFSHNYTGITECNYEFTAVIRSACDPMIVKQFRGYTVVHGRDIPADGDGELVIVDAATGLATILVCEGNEHLITIQDMSTWNCQNPTFIDGTPAPPNDEPRTIQWVYGMDNGGALMNTIGQTLGVFTPVVIGGATNTVRTINGYAQLPVITPATYQGELSQTIQIPATCRAGEYYDVYLRNWNKCNVFGIDPAVFTSIRILVVASPAPPVAPGRTICFGEPTTLTAAHGVPAGTTLTWYANANKTGLLTTGANYTPSIAIPGTYTYYVADEGIVAGNNCEGPVREVVLVVQPVITGNTIGSAQTICYNTIPAGLTGSAPGGGTGTFSYQWQSSPNNTAWTNIGGATSQNYSPGGLTSSTYYRRLITSGTCTSQSTSVLITVYGQLMPGSIGTAQSICYNTAPSGLTQTGAPSGGTGSYAYQWQSSPDNAAWANISGATSSTYSPPALTASMYYRRRVISGSCGTVYSNVILVTVYPNLTPGSIGSPQTICYNTSPAALTQTGAPAGGSGTYSYQWQSSPDNSAWSNISGATSTGYSPGSLNSNRYYRRRVTSSTCAQVYSNVVLITVYGQLTAGTIGTVQSICYNTTPAALTQLTAPGGGTGAYTYQWQSSPNNSTWTNITGATSTGYAPPALMATTYYRRRVTSGSCGTVNGSSVRITVYANLTAGTIGTAQSICYNTSPAPLTQTAAAAGGTGTYTYQWQSSPDNSTWSNIGGATAQGYSPPALTANTYYRRRVTSGSCGTVYSTSILITVYAPLNPGTIGNPQTICHNSAPSGLVQLTAPAGGTGAYTYQWQSSPDNSVWSNVSGATSATYSPPALTATTYYRRNVSSGICGNSSSSSVLITVYGPLTAGSVGSDQSICPNNAPAAFTSTGAPTGGTGAYTYQWQSSPDNTTWTNIGGATSPGYSSPVLLSTTYFRRRVTSGSCGTVNSNSIMVTVGSSPSNATFTGNGPLCFNGTGTLSSVITGGAPPYILTITGFSGSPVSNYTSGSTIDLGILPPGTHTFTLTAVVDACGTTLSAGLPKTVNIVVYNDLIAGTIGSPQSICYNTVPSPLTQTAAPTGGTGTYTYQWQSSPDNTTWANIGGATLAGYSPAALTSNTYYRRLVTSGSCGTVNSLPVLVTVYGDLTPGSIGSAQTICYNTVPAALTQSTAPSGGTGTYTYQWQSSPDNTTWSNIGGATSPGYSPAALTASTWFRRQVTSGSCGTVNSPSILITVYGNLVAGTIGNDQTICYNTIPAALSQLTAPSGGTGAYAFQWQSSPDNTTWTSIGGATSSGYAPAALTSNTYFRRQVTSGSCGTVNTPSILITVYGNLTAGAVGSPQSICYNTVPSPLTQTAAPTGGTGTYTYQWQSSPDNTTWANIGGATSAGYSPAALTANTYYRRLVTSGSCGTVNSLSVLVTVYGDLTPGSIGSAQTICYNSVPAALTQSTAPSGGTGTYTYQWQSSPDNTTWSNIGGATSPGYSPAALTASTWFRRQVTSGSCGTVNSPSILITVYGNLVAGTIGNDQTICYNTIPVALSQLTAPSGGTGAYAFQWQSSPDNTTWTSIGGATSSGYAPAALTSNTYFRRQVTSGSCGTVNTPSILITVYGNLTAGAVGSPQSICYNTVPSPLTQTAVPTGGTGTYTYQWQSSPDNTTWANIGGATSAGYSPAALTANTYYRRLVTSGSCGTVNSLSVLVTVYGNLTPGSIGSAQTICYNTVPAALTQSTAPSGGTGTYTYQWQSSPDNTTWSNIGGATSPGYSPAALTASTWFRRQVTSGSCGTVNSPSILITVYGNLVAGTIGNDQTICYNTIPAALSQLTAPSGGTGAYAFQWQSSPDNTTWTSIGGATSSGYAPAALTSNTYFRRQVTSGSCGTVNTPSILISVYPVLAGGTVGSNQTICFTEDVTAFTSTTPASGGSGSFFYTWQYTTNMSAVPGDGSWSDIPSSNSPAFDYGTLSSTTRFIRKAEEATCITPVFSNIITVTVRPQLTGGTIGTNQAVCYGTDIPSFTNIVAPSGGDNNFTYTWQYTTNMAAVPGDANWTDIAGSDVIAYDHGVLTSGTKFVRRTVDGACNTPVYSNMVTVTINPLPVTSLITGDDELCDGDVNKVFQVTNTPGSTYEWTVPPGLLTKSFDSGLYFIIADVVSGASGSGTIQVIETNTVTGCRGVPVIFNITVSPAYPGEDITGPGSVCVGDVDVAFSVTDRPGSSYTWVVPAGASISNDPGSHEILVSFSMALTGTISVVETTDGGCIILHNPKTIVINPLPAVYNLTAPVAYCDGDPGITITLNNSQTGVNYQLFRNGVPDAAPMAGNNGSALNWLNRETGTYHVVATHGTTGCSQMMNGTVVPSINVVDGGTIGNDQVICENQPPQAFVNVLAGTGGGSVTYQWQYSTDNVTFTNIAGATSALYSHAAIAQDTWFRRVAFSTMGSSICSDLSNTIFINVNSVQPGTISADQSICEATAPDALTGTPPVTEPGATLTFRWLTSTDGSTYQPIPGAISDTYTPGDLIQETWFRREVTAILSGTACIKESNAVKISMIDFNPGSVAMDQTICTGAIPASFTSVPPSGTGIFTYQWESSTDNISWTPVGGATSATFTSSALSADTWFRRVVISSFAGKQCTRYTNAVLVTVINFDPGTIGSDQTICENTAPAALTSLAPSGDGSFTYRWFNSTDGASFAQITGASGETYSPGVLMQDTWYRREVTATSGTRSCVDVTNVVRITVNNINAGSITGEQTICEGTAPNVFGSIPATSDGTLTYKWYQSSDGLVFTEIAGATSEIYSSPALVSDTWFRRDALSTLGPANCVEASNIIRITVINFEPGSIGNAQTICEGTAPAMLMGVAATGEGIKTYQWESSLNGTDWNPVPGAISVSYTPGMLDEDTWYRRVAISTLNTIQCIKYSNTVLITINNLVQGIIEEDQTICEGEVPAAFTSIAATGDGTITYQWQYSTDGVSFATISGATGETYAAVAPMADTWYRRQVISTLNGNQCTKLTTPVIVVVNNFNPGSIGSSQTICEGDTPAALTSAPPAGDGTFTYQWQQSADGMTFADIPLETSETFNPPSLTADIWYKRIVRSTDGSKVCIKETNTVRITVINFLPGSIDADQIICENTSPAPLTGVAPSGDGAFTFRWFRSNDGTTFTPIAGASGDTYIPGQLTADTWYRREVTATLNGKVCTEVTNAVRITVNNLLPGSISGDQTICEGTVPAAFSSLPATGDGAITYIWSSSSDGFNFTLTGETSETYSPPAQTEDTWFRRDAVSTLGSSVCIKESNLVRVTVLNFQPGTIGNDQTLCSGSVPAIINGVAATGDGTKTYQWESSPDGMAWTPIPGATANSYASPALISDTYFRRAAIATLNGTQCTGYSNSVIITVNNFDPGSISADQTICEGSAPVPFTGVPATGDGTITYQWQSGTDGLNFMNISGATSETYTAGVLFTDTWYRRQSISVLNGVQCTGNTMPVMVTVINFNPGTISSDQTICLNDTPAAFTATAPSGDGSFAFQWESSPDNTVWSDIPGATADTYAPGSLSSDIWFRRRVTSTLNSTVCSGSHKHSPGYSYQLPARLDLLRSDYL